MSDMNVSGLETHPLRCIATYLPGIDYDMVTGF